MPEVCVLRPLAQITTAAVVHLSFHPWSDSLVLAAADKGGRIGLWTSSAAAPLEDASAESCDDAIIELAPHYSYICGLRWAGATGQAAKLFSCSYDGSVRALDPGAAIFQLVHSDADAGDRRTSSVITAFLFNLFNLRYGDPIT